MQAQIQQGNKIPSTRSTSIGKRFASAFFAVLLAFFLVPTPAFQIAPAYADELGEAVSAGLMESAQPADSPATPKVDTSTETVTQDKADPAPDTKDTAKGDALMGLDPQTPAAPAAPEASTSDKASEEAPETDAASTPDVDASVQDDAADVATEDETETPADTEISAQEDIGVGINVQGTIRFQTPMILAITNMIIRSIVVARTRCALIAARSTVIRMLLCRLSRGGVRVKKLRRRLGRRFLRVKSTPLSICTSVSRAKIAL